MSKYIQKHTFMYTYIQNLSHGFKMTYFYYLILGNLIIDISFYTSAVFILKTFMLFNGQVK